MMIEKQLCGEVFRLSSERKDFKSLTVCVSKL